MRLLLIIAAAAVMLLEHWRLKHVYRRRECLAVMLSRAVMLLFAGLVIMPPEHIARTPRGDSLKIVVAADASASMDVKLGNGLTRREQADLLLNSPAVADGLLSRGRTETVFFTGVPQPLPPDQNGLWRIPHAPGNTCIGSTMAALLQDSRRGTPLSALVLITDGRNNDGPNPLEVARAFAADGIPVSAVGIPGDADSMDLSVKAVSRQLKAQKDVPFSLTAEVFLQGKAPETPVELELVSDGVVLDRRSLQPKAGTPVTASFDVQSSIAGFRTYMFRLNTPQEDIRNDNNTDFAAVDVASPPVFRILYLAFGLDWEWRFFRIACEANPQFAVSAIIQTGKDHFFSLLDDGQPGGKPHESTAVKAFPSSPDDYAGYDLVIANAQLFCHLNDVQRAAIRAFAEYKGGGLVIRGYDEALPADILELLPAQTIRTMTAGSPVALVALQDLVFKNDTAKALQPTKGLWLEPPAVMDVIEEPRRTTRPVVCIGRQDGGAVVAVHAFGAGRIAFVGLRDTWRWALGSGPQRDAYNAFWRHLSVWLAETARPVIKLGDDGSQVTAGEPHSFTATVLDNDFRPADAAKVTAVFTAPDGSRATVDMQPSLEIIGQYSADYVPSVSGEYRLEVSAVFPSHEQRRQAAFLAIANSRETADMSSDMVMLKDLARITHGHFYTPETYLDEKANIPLSSNVPILEERRPVFPYWLLFALFAASATASWAIRRRIGLR